MQRTNPNFRDGLERWTEVRAKVNNEQFDMTTWNVLKTRIADSLRARSYQPSNPMSYRGGWRITPLEQGKKAGVMYWNPPKRDELDIDRQERLAQSFEALEAYARQLRRDGFTVELCESPTDARFYRRLEVTM